MMLSNKSFLILVTASGLMFGMLMTFGTELEQFTCARGYTNSVSSLSITLAYALGLLGVVMAGVVVSKTGKLEEVLKICGGVTGVLVIFCLQLIRKPNMDGWILTSLPM